MYDKPSIIVFAYHNVGYECLDVLIKRRDNVIAVITHEDDPHEEVWFRSVAELAKQNNIPLYTPESVNTPEWTSRIRGWNPHLLLSFFYRNMIKEELLNVPRLGAFNMHGSLLPKYRGRAPVNWAVLNGERETGATLHVMEKKPDTGDIVDQEPVPIGQDDTSLTIFGNVTAAARRILERRIEGLLTGKAPRRPQDASQASYFGGRKPDDGLIRWHRSAVSIYDLVRAVTHPYPGAFTFAGRKRLFIWWARPLPGGGGVPGRVVSENPLRVATGSGTLEIMKLQWEGMPEEDAARGTHGLMKGSMLG